MRTRILSKLTLAGLAIAPAVLSAPAALGADEEVGALPSVQQGLVTGITALIVFGVVAVILGTQVWPKIAGALAEREKKILDEIKAAEDARSQAKAALEQYEASLAEARAEAQKMLDDTKAQQQQLAAELKAKSDAELAEMKDRARRDIETAKKAALTEIYSEASQLATSVASKILQREITGEDQSRLVEEAMGELAGSREG